MPNEKVIKNWIRLAQQGSETDRKRLEVLGIEFDELVEREISEASMKIISPIQSHRSKGRHRGAEPERIVKRPKIIMPFYK